MVYRSSGSPVPLRLCFVTIVGTSFPLLLATLLVADGFTPHEAFGRLTMAKGIQVPDTPDQVRWVERFAAARHAP
jgi:hypothetical protein